MGLKELRTRRAWSQADLARAAWGSAVTVTAIEPGTTRPQRGTLRRLAAALERNPLVAHGPCTVLAS